MERIADNGYTDGQGVPRNADTDANDNIPNERTVSNIIGFQDASDVDLNADQFNLFWIFFGQFLDHDISEIDRGQDNDANDQPITIEDGIEHETWQSGTQIPFRASNSSFDCNTIRQQYS